MTAAGRFRRRLLPLVAGGGMAALLCGGPTPAQTPQVSPTPAQPKGPFYPRTLPADRDNDLASFAGRAARGEPITIVGRVLDQSGKAIAGARVEIWQTNAGGRYHHEADADEASWDPGFQGWGETRSAADGAYRFRTIKPLAYSGRAPHIHFAVSAPGSRTFYTQMYLDGAPENARDFLLRELPEKQRSRLVTRLKAPADGAAEPTAHFDIVLP